ncbi:MAG: glutaredoxin family protein [bacterium]
MKKFPKVKIYSTPSCPYCKQAKDFMTAKGVEFENIDVSMDTEAAQEMIKKSGQMGVPVIDVGGKIIIGFDKEQLGKVLGLK